MLGFSLGITEPIVLSSLCEVLPIYLRSFALTMVWCGSATGTGSLYLSIVFFLPNYSIRLIQIVFLLCFVYTLTTAIIVFLYYSDSPRHLIFQKKSKQAFKHLEIMADRKFSKELKQEIKEETLDLAGYVKRSSGLELVFHRKNSLTSFCLIVIWIGTSLALYGPMQISSVVLKNLNQNYSSNEIVLVQFLTAVAIFSSVIVGSVMSEISSLGRRFSMFVSWVVSFFLSSVIWFYPLTLPYVMIFLGLSFGVGSNLSVTYTTEFYHTKERDYALGFFFFLSRVSGFASQFIFLSSTNINNFLPFYILSGLYAVMAIATIALPYETHGQAIDVEWEAESMISRLLNKPSNSKDFSCVG